MSPRISCFFNLDVTFCQVRVVHSLVFCAVFWRSLFVVLSFCLFLFAIVLSVLRFTVSDYPFDLEIFLKILTPMQKHRTIHVYLGTKEVELLSFFLKYIISCQTKRNCLMLPYFSFHHMPFVDFDCK